jgi:hypothetical protein
VAKTTTITLTVQPSSVSQPCSQYTPSSTIPTGYGVPWDVFSANTLVMKATCNPSNVTLDSGRGDPMQYIYNQGYSFRAGQSSWMQMPYTSTESLIANAWYPKSATGTMNLDSTQQTTDTYVLGYICT